MQGIASATRRARRRSGRSRPTSIRPCSRRSPRATRPPTTWRRRLCARRPTASSSQASSFKAGQFVAAGTPLFSLVETGDTWVEANFKETQLTHMKVGPAGRGDARHLSRTRRFTATVDSIGAGTGAEFSLLPAQNATGNWVKVTQRIPVRLKVDDPEARTCCCAPA